MQMVGEGEPDIQEGPGEATADGPTNQPDPENPISIRGNNLRLSASDIFGFAAACKTKAGQQIVKAFTDLMGSARDPDRKLLLGLAKNRVKEDQIVSLARAKAQAREITAVSDDAIARMKQRVVASEVRRQLMIEAGFQGAWEDAEVSSDNSDAVEISPDFVSRWASDVQDVTLEQCRELYSRTLSAKARNQAPLSAASLTLLKYFDEEMTEAFNIFNRWFIAYGKYPLLKYMRPDELSVRQIALMTEVGLITAEGGKFIDLDMLHIYVGGASVEFGYIHSQLQFTQRGLDLARAIYDREDKWDRGPLAGLRPSDEEVLAKYLWLVEKAMTSDREIVDFYFTAEDAREVGGFRYIISGSDGESADLILAKIDNPQAPFLPIEIELLRKICGKHMVTHLPARS
jgi:hypothetical protein